MEASLLSIETSAGLVRLLSLCDKSGVLLPSMGENWWGVGGLLGQEELLELERVTGLSCPVLALKRIFSKRTK